MGGGKGWGERKTDRKGGKEREGKGRIVKGRESKERKG
jgi:hypothetical protein